jgi:hypothetical protein
MAPQIISACETNNYSPMQFGSLFFAEKPNYMKKLLAGTAAISTKLIFIKELSFIRKGKKRSIENMFTLELWKWTLMMCCQRN